MKHLKMLLTAGFLLFSVTQSWAIPLTVGSSPQLFQFTGGTATVLVVKHALADLYHEASEMFLTALAEDRRSPARP